jgi:succinyl-diaminopimelate desuccinylase
LNVRDLTFIEACRHLISLDSTPGRGNIDAAAFVGELCESAGLVVEYQRESLDGIEQCNVIARPPSDVVGPLPVAELLLQTHIDTVEPGHFSLWTRTQANPFNASIYNDLIYGLGVAEAKLDFLCKFEAVKKIAKQKLRKPFVLAATFGAQRGMAGAIKLVRKKKIRAKWALVGSPTSMNLITAGQGLAVIELFVPFSVEEKDYRKSHDLQESSSSQSKMFSGKAAQGAMAASAENAIMKMLQYLSQLPNGIAVMDLDGGINYNSVPSSSVLEIDIIGGFKDPIVPKLSNIHAGLTQLERKLSEFRDARFEPPYPTMNLGAIRTNEDGVLLTGSCRLPPTVTDQAYEGWMTFLKETCAQNNSTFRVRDYRKGFETIAASELVQTGGSILKEMGLCAEPRAFSGASEASVFSRWGTECIVWGPGQSVGNSHAPNESIKIKDLETAIEFYHRFLERFCL